LNRTIVDEWKPYYVKKEIAGFMEEYDGNLTFGTVHGAGHMAPTDKPAATYRLVFNWLHEGT